jgi:putative transposase
MKKKRFSVEQIVGVLKQAEVGIPVVEVIRKAGISEQTFYRWKAKYVGLEVDQVRQMKQLQEENLQVRPVVFQHADRQEADATALLNSSLKFLTSQFFPAHVNPPMDSTALTICTQWKYLGNHRLISFSRSSEEKFRYTLQCHN